MTQGFAGRDARTSSFDFLEGTWDVRDSRLVEPIGGGSADWLTTQGRAAGRSYLDGSLGLDEIAFPSLGRSGMWLRLYDATTGEWSARWIDSRDGLVGSPVRGRWEDGVCRLFGQDTNTHGTRVQVRHEWTEIGPTGARWTRSFAPDRAHAWQPDWEMRFHRAAAEVYDAPVDHLPKVTSDFDFLTGTWLVKNRRLRSRLTGCTDWDEFENTFEASSHLNGLVSVDVGELPQPYPHGFMTFRTFDVAAGEWVLHWFDGADLRMDTTPVRGRFDGGVGDFIAQDSHQGIPILCRYRWIVEDSESAAWEQAFSTDDGKTWETNFTNTQTRIA